MLRFIVCAGLLFAAVAEAQTPRLRPRVGLTRGRSEVAAPLFQTGSANADGSTFRLLGPDSPYPTQENVCTAASGSLSGSYFCLDGDGTITQSGGMGLAAVGAPSAVERYLCPSGTDCSQLSWRATSIGNRWESNAVAAPTGDFTMCALLSITSNLDTTPNPMAKWGPSAAQQSTTFFIDGGGTIYFYVGDGSASQEIHAANNELPYRALNMICGTYDRVGTGTSVARLYLDGVQIASATNFNLMAASASQPWEVGLQQTSGPTGIVVGQYRGAFVTDTLLSADQISALARRTVGKLTSAQGQAVTAGRSTPAGCDNQATSGSTTIKKSLPCVTRGSKLQIEEQRTNNLRANEDIAGALWAKSAGTFDPPVVTADVYQAPDGTMTADRIVYPDTTSGSGYSVINPNTALAANAANKYSEAVYLCNGGAGTITIYQAITPDNATFRSVACTVSGSCTANPPVYTRCKLENQTFTTTDWYYQLGVNKSDVTQSGQPAMTVGVWRPQLEQGLYASSSIFTPSSSTVTRNSDFYTTANPVQTGDSKWCWAVTATPYGSGTWNRPTNYYGLLQSHTDFGQANSSSLYMENDTASISFSTWDNAGAERKRKMTGSISSGQRTVQVCKSAGEAFIAIDGVDQAVAASGAGTGLITTANATLRIGSLSALQVGAQWNGDMTNICVSRNLTGCGTAPNQMTIALGDSITRGFGVATPWPSVMRADLITAGKGAWGIRNYAADGAQTSGVLAAQWTANAKDVGFGKVLLLAGVNDFINDRTAAAAWADAKAIIDEARAQGATVVAATILPWSASGASTAQRQADTLTFNTSLRNYGTAQGFTVIDLYALMGEPGTPTALAAIYDSGDGLHPNQTGANFIATQFRTILAP